MTLHSLSLIACVVFSALASAQQTEDPRQWLDRMVQAAQTLNYDGTFIYQSGTNTESMRIIHRNDNRGERERLLSLSGVAREVLRDNRRVTCILPDDGSVMVGNIRGVNTGPLFEGVTVPDNYDLNMAGLDRVAGRVAEKVELAPRDIYRYGYRLWLDRASGLLLRNDVVEAGGHVTLESVAYTNLILMDSVPDALLEPGISGEGFKWLSWEEREIESPPSIASAQWSANWTPNGFKLHEHVRQQRPGSTEPVEHMVFSDGLASVSVFIERLDAKSMPLNGPSRVGAVSAYGRMVDQFQVTVVGEVPAATVERVGRSVERHTGDSKPAAESAGDYKY